jgi:hypothetical protein
VRRWWAASFEASPEEVQAVALIASVGEPAPPEDFLGSDRRSVIVEEFAQVGVRKHVPLLRFGMAPLDRIWLPQGQSHFAMRRLSGSGPGASARRQDRAPSAASAGGGSARYVAG